jgi:hypothetical protein
MFVPPREPGKNKFEMMLLDKPEIAEMGGWSGCPELLKVAI